MVLQLLAALVLLACVGGCGLLARAPAEEPQPAPLGLETAWQGLAPISWHPVLEEAVRALAASAQEGDVVLLAPATSSFDLYDNYMARGDDFKRIVSKLA